MAFDYKKQKMARQEKKTQLFLSIHSLAESFQEFNEQTQNCSFFDFAHEGNLSRE